MSRPQSCRTIRYRGLYATDTDLFINLPNPQRKMNFCSSH